MAVKRHSVHGTEPLKTLTECRWNN